MATLYYNAANSNYWDDLLNWWTDSAFTVQAANLPTSLDDVVICASIYDSSSMLYANTLVTVASDVEIMLVNNMTIANEATLNQNSVFISGSHIASNFTFNGNSRNQAQITGTCTFNDVSENFGIVVGDCIFNDNSWASGTVYGTDLVVLNDYSYNNTDIFSNTVFNDYSNNIDSGAVYGESIVFNDYSHNATRSSPAYITGDTIFNDNSYNEGIIYGNAIFNQNSFNSDTINGNAIFNDGSYTYSDYVYINGNATFNDSSYAYFNGSYTGSVIMGPRLQYPIQRGINGSSILGLI